MTESLRRSTGCCNARALPQTGDPDARMRHVPKIDQPETLAELPPTLLSLHKRRSRDSCCGTLVILTHNAAILRNGLVERWAPWTVRRARFRTYCRSVSLHALRGAVTQGPRIRRGEYQRKCQLDWTMVDHVNELPLLHWPVYSSLGAPSRGNGPRIGCKPQAAEGCRIAIGCNHQLVLSDVPVSALRPAANRPR